MADASLATSGRGEAMSELFTSPLFGLMITLGAYYAATVLQRRCGHSPLVNPVLVSALVLALFLWIENIPYEAYFRGAAFVHLLLGPATVALAIPLYSQLPQIRKALMPILVSVLVGSLTGIVSAVGIGWLLGAQRTTLLSLAPKSVTTPIAMGISEKIGGQPSLTVIFVIVTGILGAMIGHSVVKALGIKDWRAYGLAVGVASHGVGTGRAVQLNETAGAFASLAMGLAGLTAAVLIPILVKAFH